MSLLTALKMKSRYQIENQPGLDMADGVISRGVQSPCSYNEIAQAAQLES